MTSLPLRATRCAAVLVSLIVVWACDSPTAPEVPFSSADLVVGTGAEAVAERELTVNYTGWLYDDDAVDHKGLVFDSTAGSQPYSFFLGVGQVIDGWEQGVPGMRVGGTRRLVIPPDLAYGSSGAGVIPPNATLIFEIQLISVE
jgi:FKBP-type peptidyl-prolyl cis-trans isomerase